jgi:hypothetical protein
MNPDCLSKITIKKPTQSFINYYFYYKLVVNMVDIIATPYIVQKQIVPFSERCRVIQNLNDKLDGEPIFLAGTAYQHHMVEALKKGNCSPSEALQQLSYRKDLDLFLEHPYLAMATLGESYPVRNPKIYQYCASETQRKTAVEDVLVESEIEFSEELRREFEKEGVYLPEIARPGDYVPAIMGIDLMDANYISLPFGDAEKERVVIHLKQNTQPSGLFGNQIIVAGLSDLFVHKVASLRPDYAKDSCDTANLVMFHANDIDLDFATDVLGEEQLKSKLLEAAKVISQHPDLTEITYVHLNGVQVIPRPLEFSPNLLALDREMAVDSVYRFERRIEDG